MDGWGCFKRGEGLGGFVVGFFCLYWMEGAVGGEGRLEWRMGDLVLVGVYLLMGGYEMEVDADRCR